MAPEQYAHHKTTTTNFSGKADASAFPRQSLRPENSDMLKDDRIKRLVSAIAANASYLRYELNTLDDFSKNRMVIIEPRGGHFGNKELGSICIRTGIRHGKHAAGIMAQFSIEFIAESIPGTTGTGTEGATALNHKVWNDAMETNSIIKRTLNSFAGMCIGERNLTSGQPNEIFNSIGNEVFIKFSDHIAHGRFKTGIELSGAGDTNISEFIKADESFGHNLPLSKFLRECRMSIKIG